MLKKLGLSLLCVAATITTNTYAVTNNYSLQAGATIEYILPPNQPQLFTNYLFWSVEAHCKITTEDDSNVLYGVGLAKKGKLNDIPWSKGDTIRVTVHHGETMKMYAESGAQVSITNEGKNTVKETCSN
jgi:hypothetical protein